MDHYLTIVNLIILSALVIGDERARNIESANKTIDNFSDHDLPETELMLLDKVVLRRLLSVDSYSRKKSKPKTKPKPKQNATTSTTSSSSSSSSSTSSSSSSSGGPCTCALGVCKCCTGLILDLFNQKACMKITYHPGDFAFDVAMSMNDRILYENSLSGKNPKPICISPPRLSNLKVCARFYNVFFPGRNFHFCLAMTGQWRSIQLFDITFDCLRMGANGIAMMKPEDAGGISIPNPLGGVDAVIDAGEDDIEDYDENLVRSLFGIFEDDD